MFTPLVMMNLVSASREKFQPLQFLAQPLKDS